MAITTLLLQRTLVQALITAVYGFHSPFTTANLSLGLVTQQSMALTTPLLRRALARLGYPQSVAVTIILLQRTSVHVLLPAVYGCNYPFTAAIVDPGLVFHDVWFSLSLYCGERWSRLGYLQSVPLTILLLQRTLIQVWFPAVYDSN